MWVVVCYAAGMEASAALVQDYLQEKIRGCTVQTALGNIASAEGLLARFEGADLVIPLLTESYVSSTGGRAQLTQAQVCQTVDDGPSGRVRPLIVGLSFQGLELSGRVARLLMANHPTVSHAGATLHRSSRAAVNASLFLVWQLASNA